MSEIALINIDKSKELWLKYKINDPNKFDHKT